MRMMKLTLFVSVIMMISSCQKQSGSKAIDPSFTPEVEMKKYLTDEMGFASETIVESADGFTVGDDIFFDKATFWEKYRQASDNTGKHYKSEFKVKLKTVDVFINNNVPEEWKTAFRSAITKWNGLNLGIKFLEIPFPVHEPWHIRVDIRYGTISNTNIVAQSNGFPTAAGNPADFITINSKFLALLMNNPSRLYAAIHELGHAIGFMHSNDGVGKQIITHVAACDGQADPNSVMRTGSSTPIPFVAFSVCDKAAFNILYPK